MGDLIGGSNAGSAPAASAQGNPPAVGTVNVDWKTSLPDDIKGEASLQNITNIGDLAKSYIHAQKMVGRDKIVVPDKFATQEDWRKNVYEKLGLPSEEGKYDFKTKEGSKLDKEFLKEFKANAFQNGILPHQAEKLAEFYDTKLDAFEKAFAEGSAKRVQENIDGLKKEWGAGFDKNVKIANEVLNKFADEDTIAYLKDSGFANDTKLVKLLHKMGAAVLDDKIIGGDINSGAGLSPDEAQSEVNKIMSNKEHPYFNNNHPSHNDAMKEIQRLYGFIFQES